MEIAAAASPFRPLREELSVHPAGKSASGETHWVIEDPVSHRFFELDRRSYEILRFWSLGSPAKIAKAVVNSSGLLLDAEEVTEFAEFLDQSMLLTPASSRGMFEMWQQGQRSWFSKLLHGYLFFRVPLFRPARLLDRTSQLFSMCYTRLFWSLLALFALVGLFILMRQWDVFFATFSDYGRWQDWLWFGVALVLSKFIHEWGHALSAHRYGCRVPSMGVAFLVMWPVLYTDTNAAWKLTSRKSKLIIAASGMAAELCVAVFATWAWILTPDGPLRAAFFFLASTAWLLTLAVNLNPFMRFDGYFLLSDGLKQPNLHARSFAVGRWWLRKVLFGLQDEKPEVLTPAMTRFMVLFAWGTWLYRLILFLGIALLVYHFFFKLLGTLLMALELVWFIGRPVFNEFSHWWKRKEDIAQSKRVMLPVGLLVLAIVFLVYPWSSTLRAPAVVTGSSVHDVVALEGALLTQVAVQEGDWVEQGQLLFVTESPDLAFQLEQIEQDIRQLTWQLNRRTTAASLLKQGDLIQERLAKSYGERQRIIDQQKRLVYYAPHAGKVTQVSPLLIQQKWLAKEEVLAQVVDVSNARLVAYVPEASVAAVNLDAAASVYPDQTRLSSFECQGLEMNAMAAHTLDEALLASVFDGPIAVTEEQGGQLVPSEGVYRVQSSGCDVSMDEIALESLVTAHLTTKPQSISGALWKRVQGIFLRESGF